MTTSETGRLEEVVLKHARDAFGGPDRIAREWRTLNFSAPPDFDRAVGEYDAFAEILEDAGAVVRWLPPAADVSLDSVYVRDASVVTPGGIVLCRMGKPERETEPDAQRQAYQGWNMPILGAIQAPGRLEGGDLVWLGSRIVAVGRGYRTNDAGIAQLRALLGDTVDEVFAVPLPHWRGHGDVFHLMSIVSPVDRDLAVVYAPLLPVPFREQLLELGYRFVEVPDAEFDSMGANVLALGPRRCLALDGNPRTRALLERAGAAVVVYSGTEISVKGGGGPTCLTRPIGRVDAYTDATSNIRSVSL